MSTDPSSHDPTQFPQGLPVPIDDGAAMHLLHRPLPDLRLASTSGEHVRLNASAAIGRRAVLFFYPRTGVPGQPPSPGFSGEAWESIPGARGCTPQSCGFRDQHEEFEALGVRVWGVSTNTTEHQLEFKRRLEVSFDFLSDDQLRLVRALKLPTFEFPVESGGPTTLVRRMAWYVDADATGVPRIRKVWYPVFPPAENAARVIEWIRRRDRVTVRPIDSGDAEFVRGELVKHWTSTTIYSRGEPFEADRLPGFVAWVGGKRAGLLTLATPGRGAPEGQCEIVTLSALDGGNGVGSRLMEAAEDEARRLGCSRIFLTTSNDNFRAMSFYQRRGWRLRAVYPGMIDRCRVIQQQIPRVTADGVPIRDELEFDLRLGDATV
ncbi:MAG: GNAT family N-acetyltransferase [Phycisphaerales bacterium]|nr:GNAT family N-acetyltransferase [Phycisphaerales bacterium]